MKKARTSQTSLQKAVAGKKGASLTRGAKPLVLKLPKVGKIKRVDIRKAVQAVRQRIALGQVD